jgi:hypothetical protein
MKKILFGLAVVIAVVLGFFFAKDSTFKEIPLFTPPKENQSIPQVFESQKEKLPPLDGVNLALLHTIAEEAPKLDSTQVDAEAAELKALAQAQVLNDSDMDFLVKLVQSDSSTANQKIYSIYLLDMSKEKAWKYLKEIALSPLKNRVTAPHSMDEVNAMQEKSLVFMAIDALAEQAISDQKARAELEKWAETAPSREAQEYILEKLKELSNPDGKAR